MHRSPADYAILAAVRENSRVRVAVASSDALRWFAWQKVNSAPSVRSIRTHIVYEHRSGPGNAGPSDPA